MSHLDADALLALARGALDDEAATRVAVHLDACAACQARALATDPLHAVLMAAPDPVVPPALAHRALAQLRVGGGRREAAAGALLLALAATLAIATGQDAGAWAPSVVSLRTLHATWTAAALLVLASGGTAGAALTGVLGATVVATRWAPALRVSP